MSWIPKPPLGSEPSFDPTEISDPFSRRFAERQRWERRTRQLAALALARMVFGKEANAEISSLPGRGGFDGFLTVEVPFSTLDRHRRLEDVFLACAALDPVLSDGAFLYMFSPHLSVPAV